MNMWEYNILHNIQLITEIALEQTKNSNCENKDIIYTNIINMYNDIMKIIIARIDKTNIDNETRKHNINELIKELRGL